MALPAQQYRTFKNLFRNMLSVGGVSALDSDVLRFFQQLMTDSSGSTALSAPRNFLCGEIFRRILSGDASNPSDADVVAFWTQLATDAAAVTAMGQTGSYRTMFEGLRGAISCDGLNPSSADVLSYFSAYGDWTHSTQLLGRWEAGSLVDMANGPFGALVSTGGAVTTTPGVIDGQPVWSLTKAGGIRLVSTNLIGTGYFAPYTLVVIARATGVPALGDRLFDIGNSGGYGLAYFDGLNLIYQDGQNNLCGMTTANFNALVMYSHCSAGRFALGSGAYSAANNGQTAGTLFGVTLGANRNGTSPGGWDIAAVFAIEGQMTAAFGAGLFAYCRAKWPSVFATATPQAQFSVDQASRGALPVGAFDIIVGTGQSNNCCEADTATTAPGANTYLLDHDNNITAMKTVYDSAGSGGRAMDPICRTATVLGGNATKLCNDYVAATGRPVLFIPCANGGSQLLDYSSPPYAQPNTWDPQFPLGHKLRNSLYGSTLARLKNAIALGGTFRFFWHYQGEAEALLGGAPTTTFAANTTALFNQLCADAAVSKRVIVQTISDNVAAATAPAIAAVQAQQATLAASGSVLVLPKNNNTGGDGIHLNGTGCDQVGAAAAAAALAQTAGTGWY